MLRTTLAAAAASLLLLGAQGARAQDALPAIADGTSNTILLPELPPQPDPPAPIFSHELAGSAKLKAGGAKSVEPYSLQVNFDTAELTFLAMDGDGTLYGGNLAPRGTRGGKFKLFLDAGSRDAFAADVAARGASASGRTAGSVLGDTSKLTLAVDEDGSASLKIKSEVLVDGLGEVVFKANLVGVASGPASAAVAMIRQNGFVEGGKCTVVDGLNRGKSGTYEDGFCCGKFADGSDAWCTECTGSDKCKEATSVLPPILNPGLVRPLPTLRPLR